VFEFRLCLVATEPNWKMALRLSLTLAGSYFGLLGAGRQAASHRDGKYCHSKQTSHLLFPLRDIRCRVMRGRE